MNCSRTRRILYTKQQNKFQSNPIRDFVIVPKFNVNCYNTTSPSIVYFPQFVTKHWLVLLSSIQRTMDNGNIVVILQEEVN